MRVFVLPLILAAVTTAVEFRFTNKCDYTINLHGAGSKFICNLDPGAVAGNNCGAVLGEMGLFKHTESNEANLVEYSLVNVGTMNQAWYDVSNIPPGPGFCTSYADCQQATGRKGYNVPVSVTPTKYSGSANCKSVTVTAPDDPDAYLFPKDDFKTHDCPMDEVFDVVYCPNGSVAPKQPPQTTATPPTTPPATYAPATTKPPATTATPVTTAAPAITATPATTTTVVPKTPSPPVVTTHAPATTATPPSVTPTVVPVPTTDAPSTNVPSTDSPSTYPTPAPQTTLTPSSGAVKPWQQCGGKDYSGSATCVDGHSCVAVNSWYSQCIPDAVKAGELPTWAECGERIQGHCQDRDVCSKHNDYFSQCTPKVAYAA
ncbi:Aste57867_16316 [Aphanomyces stellatus]|uniref:Aste57867_16316 protein n=1 Tax=Aphanomyces stellatus TaxID=120398 RepID=A0A485L570_9STRA|nr:hypothetical protein As57867_016259 [Aphanomyces stellatus]VFT93092.1 Aste57867_16316 [Aphanomyces stellatus]